MKTRTIREFGKNIDEKEIYFKEGSVPAARNNK